MDTIRMVTAMVMLTVRRMSRMKVGRGTIMRPTITATQATRSRSLKRVSTPARLPPRTSFPIWEKFARILLIMRKGAGTGPELRPAPSGMLQG